MMKENTTWQTVYEKLQEFLKKYKFDFRKKEKQYPDLVICHEDYVYIEKWYVYFKISYHDIFSKDSWIMERVEWKEDENIKSITITEHWWFQYDIKRSPYYEMSWLTAEEKCIYFNKYAKLPTKSE